MPSPESLSLGGWVKGSRWFSVQGFGSGWSCLYLAALPDLPSVIYGASTKVMSLIKALVIVIIIFPKQSSINSLRIFLLTQTFTFLQIFLNLLNHWVMAVDSGNEAIIVYVAELMFQNTIISGERKLPGSRQLLLFAWRLTQLLRKTLREQRSNEHWYIFCFCER